MGKIRINDYVYPSANLIRTVYQICTGCGSINSKNCKYNKMVEGYYFSCYYCFGKNFLKYKDKQTKCQFCGAVHDLVGS